MRIAPFGSWLCCLGALAAGEADAEAPVGPEPSRMLELHIAAPRPLTLPATLSLRIVNPTEKPIGLGIDHDSFRSGIVTIHAPAEGDGAWVGPAAGEPLAGDATRVRVDGWRAGATATAKEAWNAREPLLLTAGEGYARTLRLDEGFLTDAKARTAVVQATLVVWEHPAVDLPPTPRPGQVIALGEARDVVVGRTVSVPIKRGKAEAEPPVDGPVSLSAFVLPATAGDDVVVGYCVGATDAPVWLWQNALWPAAATFTVTTPKGGKPLATIDGAALQDRVAWLPARAARQLMPGEALVFQRTIPAAALTAMKTRKARLTVTLPVAHATSAPTADAQPPAAVEMEATCDLEFE
ncbi:MAG TPA: hypothetical protein VEL07_12905 [Planctomycetota bacterium]|nr:hypothetical protein [Planctomycetota bacterium]